MGGSRGRMAHKVENRRCEPEPHAWLWLDDLTPVPLSMYGEGVFMGVAILDCRNTEGSVQGRARLRLAANREPERIEHPLSIHGEGDGG